MSLSASGRHGNIVKATGEGNEGWVALQQKAFTAWVNQHLSVHKIVIKDIVDELQDGVYLCLLIEGLARTPLKKWTRKPKTRFERLENVSAAFEMLKRQSVKLAAIGPEDIVDPKQKLILGLIWLLILRYHLSSAGDTKNQMIKWVRERVAGFGLECKDLTAASWGDGRVYVGIVHSIRPVPGVSNPASLSGDALSHIRNAMNFAESDLEVPHILDPEDILNPEELSMLTYLGFFKLKTEAAKDAVPPSVDVQATGEGISKATVGRPAQFSLTLIDQPKSITTPRAAPAPVLPPALTVCAEEAFKATDKDNSGTVNQEELIHVLERILEGRVAADKIRKVALGQMLLTGGEQSAEMHLSDFIAVFAALQEYFPAPDALSNSIKAIAAAPLSTSSTPRSRSLSLSQSTCSLAKGTADFAAQGFKLEIEAPDGPLTATVANSPVAQCFDVTYTAHVPGAHQINLSYKGAKLRSWTAQAVPGGPDAANSSAEGEGLQVALVGLPAIFNIQLRDVKGVAVDGADALAVAIPDVTPAIKQSGTGVYEVTYTAGKEGPLPVQVQVSGAHVKGSPFAVEAEKATARLAASKATGIAGKPFDFTVATKLPVGVTARSLAPVLQVTANGAPQTGKETDGTHAYSVTPSAAKLRIEATLAGLPVEGSPLECSVASAEKSKLTGPDGVQRVNTPSAFTITICDADGAPISALAHLSIKFGDDTVTGLKEKSPGHVEFSVSPKTAGNYQVSADLAGAALQGSPYKLTVVPSVSAQNSTFALEGAAIAGAPVRVRVTAKDSAGNVVDAETEKCKVTPEAKEELPVAYIGKGVFEATTTQATPTKLHLFATLNGVAVPPSPLEVSINSAASPLHTRAEGDGLRAAEPGIPAKFTIHTCDANGNSLTYGGDKVTAWLEGPDGKKVPVEIKDDGKGGYHASYTVPGEGKWNLHVELNGMSISGSPFTVEAMARADPSKCRVFGLGLTKATASKRASFCVELRSAAGLPVSVAPYIRVRDEEVAPVALGDGLFDVEYRSSAEGPLDIAVTIDKDGKTHVPKSPFRVTVAPATKRVRTWTLMVSCADEQGNIQSASGVEVKVTGPDGLTVPATVAHEKGSLRLVIEPHMVGNYLVSVTAEGEHVTGSPFCAAHAP